MIFISDPQRLEYLCGFFCFNTDEASREHFDDVTLRHWYGERGLGTAWAADDSASADATIGKGVEFSPSGMDQRGSQGEPEKFPGRGSW